MDIISELLPSVKTEKENTMKQVTKMSRLTSLLEKMYRQLNQDFFGGVLPPVMITVTPSAKAYGHYTLNPVWKAGGDALNEINIGAGTLDRDLDEIVATLTHEAVHHFCSTVLHVQDCSRSTKQYHNKIFKREAEAHGLIVEHSDKYGWSHTKCSDELLQWVLENDFREIQMCRADSYAYGGITKPGNGGVTPVTTKRSHNRKYFCEKCNASVRATKTVKLICGECFLPMICLDM